MASLPESRTILWLSAAIVAAAHAAVLFAWSPSASTPGVLLDEESSGVEVDLVASADQGTLETSAPMEETPAPEPVELANPEPTPVPQEPEPAQEQTEIAPEAEQPPAPLSTPMPPRPTPRATVAKPKKAASDAVGKPGASPQLGSAPGSGSPAVAASQAAFAKRPSLLYPAESRQAREEGTVIIRITVDAQGRPTQVFVLKGSGFPRLDRAALEGAWRCKIRNAKAGMILDIPLRFDLDE